MSLIDKVKRIFKRKGKDVKLSSRDTSKALLDEEILKEDFKRSGECLSGTGVSFKYIKVPKIIEKKVKTIDILKSYGLSDKEAKRYLRYKYILKYSKSGRIRLKANKMLGSFCFNDKYKGEEL